MLCERQSLLSSERPGTLGAGAATGALRWESTECSKRDAGCDAGTEVEAEGESEGAVMRADTEEGEAAGVAKAADEVAGAADDTEG